MAKSSNTILNFVLQNANKFGAKAVEQLPNKYLQLEHQRHQHS